MVRMYKTSISGKIFQKQAGGYIRRKPQYSKTMVGGN